MKLIFTYLKSEKESQVLKLVEAVQQNYAFQDDACPTRFKFTQVNNSDDDVNIFGDSDIKSDDSKLIIQGDFPMSLIAKLGAYMERFLPAANFWISDNEETQTL